MDNFKKLVLNIPHSSIERYDNGWGGKFKLFPTVKKWTDWHTDLLFAVPEQMGDVIKSFRFPYSRFYCDVERLINDPLADIGQGIIYRKFDGFERVVSDGTIYDIMSAYNAYIGNMSLAITDNTCVIDCHSFPSDLSDMVDICIGFNEDYSKPSDEVLNKVTNIFTEAGFNVDWNVPYSNSITPNSNNKNYKSIMIEVNKKLYMDENTLELYTSRFDYLKRTIDKVYLLLLGKTI